MSPNDLPLSATLKIMVLSYGDHLSNNILWAKMVIGRNGYGQKWSWTKMVMGRNNPEPLYNMSRDMRKQIIIIIISVLEPVFLYRGLGKTNITHMRKQRREADQRLCFR